MQVNKLQHNEELEELSLTGQRQVDKEINQPQHVVSNLVARMLSNCKTVLIREQRDHFQDEMARDNDLHNINNRYNYLFFIVLRERCYMKYYQAISIRSKL